MTSNSLYVITPIEYFQEKYNYYLSKGFTNRGSVRYSLDGTKVLLEEGQEIFDNEDLLLDGVQSFNREEVIAYLLANSSEWEEPVVDGDVV